MKYFEIMRPSHWTKNVFVFAAVIFGKKLFAPADEMLLAFGSALGAFFCFCLASSAIDIFNDIIDRETDRLHPEKKYRPIAAGTVPVAPAAVLSVICAATAIVCSFMLVQSLVIIILAYIVLMILYSLCFKKMI